MGTVGEFYISVFFWSLYSVPPYSYIANNIFSYPWKQEKPKEDSFTKAQIIIVINFWNRLTLMM